MMLEIIDLLYGQNNRGVTRYMRSGSPANDGNGWSSAQHSHSDEPLGSQGRYGSGARSEPRDPLGSGRREEPFGPEISWPYGFRKLDPQSRDVLESAYGTNPVYQQPAMDDYGYGDPGYSDPSYEGPKTPYGSPGFPGGHRNSGAPGDFGGPGYRRQPQAFASPSGRGDEIWPVTGSQEALSDQGGSGGRVPPSGGSPGGRPPG